MEKKRKQDRDEKLMFIPPQAGSGWMVARWIEFS